MGVDERRGGVNGVMVQGKLKTGGWAGLHRNPSNPVGGGSDLPHPHPGGWGSDHRSSPYSSGAGFIEDAFWPSSVLFPATCVRPWQRAASACGAGTAGGGSEPREGAVEEVGGGPAAGARHPEQELPEGPGVCMGARAWASPQLLHIPMNV